MSRRSSRTAVRAALALVAVLALGAGVAVAQAPVATTEPATKVTSTTATLNGTVVPNQSGTTYYFQYGPTTAYGTQTPTQPVNGMGAKSVSADVTGLSPSTTYHYRLVAVNSAGTTFGADATFTTTASDPDGRRVTIDATRTVLRYGRTTTISGKLTGPDNAGKLVTLEENPYPYTGGYTPTTTTATTDANGDYSMVVKPVRNTRYRVTVKTAPPSTSAELAITVRLKVTRRVSDRTPERGSLVRFSGKVVPGHDGQVARIQRRTADGDWKTVARATLVAAAPVDGVARSTYSKRVRVRSTRAYRVRVSSADGDHATGTSRRIRLVVE